MAEFSKGDRVMRSAAWSTQYGRTGTVFSVKRHNVWVEFDDGEKVLCCDTTLSKLPSAPPIQLEAGKWYRTRGGRKVLAVGIDSVGSWIVDRKDGMLLRYCSDGRTKNGFDSDDIIGEWVEEPTDAEIAEAVRFAHKNPVSLQEVPCLCTCGTPREFVDKVNEYREEADE